MIKTARVAGDKMEVDDDDEFETEDEDVEVSWVDAEVDVGMNVGMEEDVCSRCSDVFERVDEVGKDVERVEV